MTNTAFLDALKAKRTMPQTIEHKISDLAKKVADNSSYKINPSPVIPLSDLMPKQDTVETHVKDNGINKTTLVVELVTNKNRIDLFFSQKPSESKLTQLRSFGWHYRPSDKAWYHQDNKSNRQFLINYFDVDLDLEESKSPQAESIPSDSEPKFEAFKTKVNKLVEYFKIEPADLMLLAIDALFEKHEKELN